MRHGLVLAALAATLGTARSPQEAPDFRAERREMVRDQIASRLGGRTPVTDTAVLRTMETVPRHRFVRPGDVRDAYSDRPLPIGHGQTISQPYIVAVMTQLLELGPDDVVLEVGTGSGYQAAVLAELADSVYTVEIVEPLAVAARRRLEALGYDRVTVRTGDGYFGWPDHPPFDGIVVTAAASHIPPPLVEQLKPGGRMVIPVGAPFQVQSLLLVEKRADGSVVQRNVGAVRFVPLTRGD
ncbi:MAG: protein-L-isoaspartate(D-aspartate) O-methyltransferase [Gemmatimonadota bacterium]